jgi:uncharacterized BrkB/YihY/UPF0761 family membrane protein
VDPSVRERTPQPPPETTPKAPAERSPGRLDSLRVKARDANVRLLEARDRNSSIDFSFSWMERERRLAASVLAGGIAYRLFFWLLPAALVLGGVLGFSSSESAEDRVGEAVADAGRGRWALLLVGLGALLWTSSWSVVAMRRVYALIWGVAAPSGGNPLKDALGFGGILALLISIPAAAAWLRSVSPGPGLALELLAIAAFFGIWLWASARLPHSDAPLRALVPGALLAAVGAQAIYLVTVFYIAVKLERASALYGGLGVAATFLFVLWIVGRLVISSAILNAELWRRAPRDPPSASISPG